MLALTAEGDAWRRRAQRHPVVLLADLRRVELVDDERRQGPGEHTVRSDALSLVVEALYRRLIANGSLRADHVQAMRVMAMAFPASLEAAQDSQ